MIEECELSRPLFITLPDVVGSARRTLELFALFEDELNGLPRALVLQDGIGEVAIPWRSISAVFVGGTDAFKISRECTAAVTTAKLLDLWVHVGRVNEISRAIQFLQIADSIDGSGLSQYDHQLSAMVTLCKGDIKQADIFNDDKT